uniref:Uncharacterized protein n=1 Tax=Anopheles braziliensis TaxID=58242 RepID=A0A2M3ZM08_9DIPT
MHRIAFSFALLPNTAHFLFLIFFLFEEFSSIHSGSCLSQFTNLLSHTCAAIGLPRLALVAHHPQAFLTQLD